MIPDAHPSYIDDSEVCSWTTCASAVPACLGRRAVWPLPSVSRRLTQCASLRGPTPTLELPSRRESNKIDA
eukprot:1098107-Amphidinium_carterae.1